jgi:hypothetical protein
MTCAEFWRHYLQAHSRPDTRLMHYAGSVLALGALGLAAVTRDWRWCVAAPLVGYAFAWAAHFGLEGNRPATFGHLVWSLVSDCRMLLLWVFGRLRDHLAGASACNRFTRMGRNGVTRTTPRRPRT